MKQKHLIIAIAIISIITISGIVFLLFSNNSNSDNNEMATNKENTTEITNTNKNSYTTVLDNNYVKIEYKEFDIQTDNEKEEDSFSMNEIRIPLKITNKTDNMIYILGIGDMAILNNEFEVKNKTLEILEAQEKKDTKQSIFLGNSGVKFTQRAGIEDVIIPISIVDNLGSVLVEKEILNFKFDVEKNTDSYEKGNLVFSNHLVDIYHLTNNSKNDIENNDTTLKYYDTFAFINKSNKILKISIDGNEPAEQEVYIDEISYYGDVNYFDTNFLYPQALNYITFELTNDMSFYGAEIKDINLLRNTLLKENYTARYNFVIQEIKGYKDDKNYSYGEETKIAVEYNK